ncbi:hypothetical protein D3C85_1796690 [compost metagenome]
MTDSGLPRRVATPFTWGCDSGSLVSGGQGMISLTLSRLIAINLPLRRVNSSRDNESARAARDLTGAANLPACTTARAVPPWPGSAA